MQRRQFLQAAAAGSVAISAGFSRAAKKPRILLRSSWQTVNIGDIAHTPGVLALLEKSLPEAEVWLWPSNVDNGVQEILEKRFPQVRLVRGQAAIKEAFDSCDFLLHGSGPSLVEQRDVQRWHEEAKKPFGVWGITLSNVPEDSRKLLTAADFVLFRDTVSLKLAQEQGIESPVMQFGPDGAFNVDLANDAAAEKFLEQHRLEPGEFLCCIPRLRFTPYWKIKNLPFSEERHARNEAMKEHDHAPIREAITALVQQTGKKVLLCPEDRSQMEVGRENLYDKLPSDVKQEVVWREDYWLTDEALSTYKRSAGLFGLEMHSPIMCVGNGIPAIVCRFAEQTSKGYMWRDIGLNDWLFNLDNAAEFPGIKPAVLSLVTDREQTLAKTEAARSFVMKTQQENIKVLQSSLAKVV